MQDPKPENIEGTKRVAHTVEHRVDWGHVALGIGLLALVWLIHRHVDLDDEDDDEEVMS